MTRNQARTTQSFRIVRFMLKNEFSPRTDAVAYPGVLTPRDVVAIIVAFSGLYTYKYSQFRSTPLVQLANSIMGWVCQRPTKSCTHTLKHLYNENFLNRATYERFSKLGNWTPRRSRIAVLSQTLLYGLPLNKSTKNLRFGRLHISYYLIEMFILRPFFYTIQLFYTSRFGLPIFTCNLL